MSATAIIASHTHTKKRKKKRKRREKKKVKRNFRISLQISSVSALPKTLVMSAFFAITP